MKVGIFIDGKTLYYGLKKKTLSFSLFKDWLVGKDILSHATYFNCLDKTETKKSFFGHVFKSGFKIFIRKPFKENHGELIFFNLSDIELTIDAVNNINSFDKFVLVSGKNDFLPLVEFMKEHNKDIELVGFKDNIGVVFNKYNIKYIEDFFEEVKQNE